MVRPRASDHNLRIAAAFSQVLMLETDPCKPIKDDESIAQIGCRSLFPVFATCLPHLARIARDKRPKFRNGVSYIELNKYLQASAYEDSCNVPDVTVCADCRRPQDVPKAAADHRIGRAPSATPGICLAASLTMSGGQCLAASFSKLRARLPTVGNNPSGLKVGLLLADPGWPPMAGPKRSNGPPAHGPASR